MSGTLGGPGPDRGAGDGQLRPRLTASWNRSLSEGAS